MKGASVTQKVRGGKEPIFFFQFELMYCELMLLIVTINFIFEYQYKRFSMKLLYLILTFSACTIVYAGSKPQNHEANTVGPLLQKMLDNNAKHPVSVAAQAALITPVKGVVNATGMAAWTGIATAASPVVAVTGHPKTALKMATRPLTNLVLKPAKQIYRAGKAIWLLNDKRAANNEMAKLSTHKSRFLKQSAIDKNWKREKPQGPTDVTNATMNAMVDSFKESPFSLPSQKSFDRKGMIGDYYTKQRELREGNTEVKKGDLVVMPKKVSGLTQEQLKELSNFQSAAAEEVSKQANWATKLFKRKSVKNAMKEAIQKASNEYVKNLN